MKVTQLISSASRKGGGVFLAASQLTRSLTDLDIDVSVLALEDEYTHLDSGAFDPAQVHAVNPRWAHGFGFAPQLRGALINSAAEIVHSHGLWMYPSVACNKWAMQTGRPYVISPHGMLDQWALQQSRWKKRIAGCLFQKKNLRRAACVHALCPSEAESIRSYCPVKIICVIPNAVDIQEQPMTQAPPWADGGR